MKVEIVVVGIFVILATIFFLMMGGVIVMGEVLTLTFCLMFAGYVAFMNMLLSLKKKKK